MATTKKTNATGSFDPWEDIPVRVNKAPAEPEESQVEEQQVQEEPSEVRPKRQYRRKQKPVEVQKEPEELPREKEKVREIRCAFRCTPKFKKEIEDYAWNFFEGDMSQLIRASITHFMKYLLEEYNGGKPLEPRPEAPKPPIISRIFMD